MPMKVTVSGTCMGQEIPEKTVEVPTVAERREEADKLLKEAHRLLCEANELRRLAGLEPVDAVKWIVLDCW